MHKLRMIFNHSRTQKISYDRQLQTIFKIMFKLLTVSFFNILIIFYVCLCMFYFKFNFK